MSRRPPGRDRRRAAWAAGLRPRSRFSALAVLSLLVALALAWAPDWPRMRLGATLEQAFAGPLRLPELAEIASLLRSAALPLLAAIVLALALSLRPRPPLRPAIDPRELAIPLWTIALMTTLGLATILLRIDEVVPAAARSVDASARGLALAWLGWTWRVALAVLASASLLALLEWLVSGLRLWQALHLTRAQQRELARERERRARS